MSPVQVTRGDSPLVLAMPHGGTWLPDRVRDALNETGLAIADTDWHIAQLYAALAPEATVVQSLVHRYAIDANRDPSGASLYPGQNTTGLCPLTDFDGRPIYRPGQEPDAAEIAHRIAAWHAPYHATLAAELDRVRARHGHAVLYDCHSIRSAIPFLFEGTLPDFNIGTNGGASCDPALAATVESLCRETGRTTVLNGRFKGGWTTRHYGRPAEGVHAIQMELAQVAYMTEAPPWPYDPDKAGTLRPSLRRILAALTEWSPP